MLLSYIRTIVLYLVLIAVIRLMGKRQIGEMEPAEFVVALLVADLASIPMQDGGIPLYSGLIPMVTVLGIELILSAACLRSVRLRRLLCGKPVILIDNGKILGENLKRTRITLDELSELLRQKDVLQVETVQYAILETNGNLSVFLYPKYQPACAGEAGIQAKPQYLPYTIIADGKLYPDNLVLSGRDRKWLRDVLVRENCRVEEVFLLTVDQKDHIFCLKKEDSR